MRYYTSQFPGEPWLDTFLYSGLPRWVEELGLQGDGPPLSPTTFRNLVQDSCWLRDWITARFRAGYSASMVSVLLRVPSTVWRPESLTPVQRDRRAAAEPRADAWDTQLAQWSDLPNAWAHTLLRERTMLCDEKSFIAHFREMRKELHNVDTSNVEERRLSPVVMDSTQRSLMEPVRQRLLEQSETEDLFDPEQYIKKAATADNKRSTGNTVVQLRPRKP